MKRKKIDGTRLENVGNFSCQIKRLTWIHYCVVSPPCVFTVFHDHSYSTFIRRHYSLQTAGPKIPAPTTNSVHCIPGSVPGVGRGLFFRDVSTSIFRQNFL